MVPQIRSYSSRMHSGESLQHSRLTSAAHVAKGLAETQREIACALGSTPIGMLNHERFPIVTHPLLRNPPIQCALMTNSEVCLYLECSAEHFGRANDLSARYAR